jgi:hypothetical protein
MHSAPSSKDGVRAQVMIAGKKSKFTWIGFHETVTPTHQSALPQA